MLIAPVSFEISIGERRKFLGMEFRFPPAMWVFEMQSAIRYQRCYTRHNKAHMDSSYK